MHDWGTNCSDMFFNSVVICSSIVNYLPLFSHTPSLPNQPSHHNQYRKNGRKKETGKRKRKNKDTCIVWPFYLTQNKIYWIDCLHWLTASMETMQEQSDMIGMATNTSLPQKRGWEDEIGAGLTDKKWPGWDCTNLWTQKWPGWDCKNLTYSGLWWVLTVDTCMCRKCCNWILQNEFLPLAHYHILTSLNSTVLIL